MIFILNFQAHDIYVSRIFEPGAVGKEGNNNYCGDFNLLMLNVDVYVDYCHRSADDGNWLLSELYLMPRV